MIRKKKTDKKPKNVGTKYTGTKYTELVHIVVVEYSGRFRKAGGREVLNHGVWCSSWMPPVAVPLTDHHVTCLECLGGKQVDEMYGGDLASGRVSIAAGTVRLKW